LIKNLSIGTGRRKTAVARVFLREGKGKIIINRKELDEYFPLSSQRMHITKVLDVTSNTGTFDILITVKGSGHCSQADACRHGLARALASFDSTNIPVLRANGFLTRDSRMVERKKYGKKGARKKFQFSKR